MEYSSVFLVHFGIRIKHLRSSEINDFEALSFEFNQDVFRLQVSVHYLVIVAVHYGT